MVTGRSLAELAAVVARAEGITLSSEDEAARARARNDAPQPTEEIAVDEGDKWPPAYACDVECAADLCGWGVAKFRKVLAEEERRQENPFGVPLLIGKRLHYDMRRVLDFADARDDIHQPPYPPLDQLFVPAAEAAKVLGIQRATLRRFSQRRGLELREKGTGIYARASSVLEVFHAVKDRPLNRHPGGEIVEGLSDFAAPEPAPLVDAAEPEAPEVEAEAEVAQAAEAAPPQPAQPASSGRNDRLLSADGQAALKTAVDALRARLWSPPTLSAMRPEQDWSTLNPLPEQITLVDLAALTDNATVDAWRVRLRKLGWDAYVAVPASGPKSAMLDSARIWRDHAHHLVGLDDESVGLRALSAILGAPHAMIERSAARHGATRVRREGVSWQVADRIVRDLVGKLDDGKLWWRSVDWNTDEWVARKNVWSALGAPAEVARAAWTTCTQARVAMDAEDGPMAYLPDLAAQLDVEPRARPERRERVVVFTARDAGETGPRPAPEAPVQMAAQSAPAEPPALASVSPPNAPSPIKRVPVVGARMTDGEIEKRAAVVRAVHDAVAECAYPHLLLDALDADATCPFTETIHITDAGRIVTAAGIRGLSSTPVERIYRERDDIGAAKRRGRSICDGAALWRALYPLATGLEARGVSVPLACDLFEFARNSVTRMVGHQLPSSSYQKRAIFTPEQFRAFMERLLGAAGEGRVWKRHVDATGSQWVVREEVHRGLGIGWRRVQGIAEEIEREEFGLLRSRKVKMLRAETVADKAGIEFDGDVQAYDSITVFTAVDAAEAPATLFTKAQTLLAALAGETASDAAPAPPPQPSQAPAPLAPPPAPTSAPTAASQAGGVTLTAMRANMLRGGIASLRTADNSADVDLLLAMLQ